RRTTTTAPRCGSRWRWTSRFPTPRPSTCPSRRRPRPSTSPDRVKRSRIVVRELTKTFRDGGREVAAVQDASFEILDGEFVAIVGPSGCGKSTILNMIGGLGTPPGGGVEIDGVRVAASVPLQVGYVFQKDTVFPWRTVARNIAVGLEYRGVARAEQEGRLRTAIGLAGLAVFEEAFPATLSGGMRQRVVLMRTLVV